MEPDTTSHPFFAREARENKDKPADAIQNDAILPGRPSFERTREFGVNSISSIKLDESSNKTKFAPQTTKDKTEIKVGLHSCNGEQLQIQKSASTVGDGGRSWKTILQRNQRAPRAPAEPAEARRPEPKRRPRLSREDPFSEVTGATGVRELSARELDRQFARVIGSKGRHLDDMEDAADEMLLTEQRERTAPNTRRPKRKRVRRTRSTCPFCEGRVTEIARSPGAVLALPRHGGLCAGHVIVFATEHAASSSSMSAAAFEEVRAFLKCLDAAAARRGERYVFVENGFASDGDDSVEALATLAGAAVGRHSVIHCIPVSADAFARAPMVFRATFQDLASDWRANKEVVRVPRGSRHRGFVPREINSLAVLFGADGGGLIHPIEDTRVFDRGVGLAALASLLGLDAFHARARRTRAAPEKAAEQRQRFEDEYSWAQFDWTRALARE
eukprot:gnl/Chilomastix_cuspidata/5608.p1 GENE.gnl/Chilomastix_cuspidata/5608~~gnl/Chilomastix_cuspidata/5608.p1  ORF type:complete len:452 (-),score=115.99 gnl/Chilomastix_cuspidata/5608:14-1348(-)